MVSAANSTISTRRWTIDELLRTLSADGNAVSGFVRTDSRLISTGLDGEMRLWNHGMNELLREFKKTNGCVGHLVGQKSMFTIALKIEECSHRVEIWDPRDVMST